MTLTPSSLAGRTVLVVHAHPDDEAIFTGITMRRLADAGARVVLVTATLGELGEVLVPLRRDETVAQRRVAELERAADLLGAARLVLLGRRDSGLPGAADNVHPDALAQADVERVARRLAELTEAEHAEAIVHYDAQGIYGHPDHVAVHRIGHRAAQLAGVVGYESTIDAHHLHPATSRTHLVHGAADASGLPFGLEPSRIGVVLEATPDELAVKHAAIGVHASQVSPDALGHRSFAESYGYEWYARSGEPGILDELTATRGAPVTEATFAGAPGR